MPLLRPGVIKQHKPNQTKPAKRKLIASVVFQRSYTTEDQNHKTEQLS